MFLDQKLYEIGKQVNLLSEESVENTIVDMFMACINDSKKHLNPDNGATDNDFLPVFKRINTSWNMAVNRLNKEGIKFTVVDGYKIQMQRMTERGYYTFLKEIINNI